MVIYCVVGCQIKIHPLDFIMFQEFEVNMARIPGFLVMRGKKWFSVSKRSDVNVNALHHIVCSVDFVSGKPAALFETSIYHYYRVK